MQKFSVLHIPRYSLILFKALQQPFILYLIITGNAIMFGCAYLLLQAEHGINPKVNNYFDALWWAMSTVTTVGYGDISPYTVTGRLIGMVLMVCGIIFFVGFTAVLVSTMTALIESEFEEDSNRALKQEIVSLHQKVDALSKKLDDLSLKKS